MTNNVSNTQEIEQGIFKMLKLDFSDDDPIWCKAPEIIITGGWRSGKSTRGAARALRQLLRPNEEGGLLWLLGPDYIQAREEFRYLVDWSMQLGIYAKHSFPGEGQCRLVTNTGWEVLTKSAKHPERLGSVAPDGIVLCEPGQMPEEAYIMVMGRLMQKGGWMMACGTLEAGDGHPNWLWYEEMANEWQKHAVGHPQRAFSLPSWVNKRWFPGGEHDPKIEKLRQQLSEYTFARRIAGLPVGVEHPCFDLLWDTNARDRFCLSLSEENAKANGSFRFLDGAFGVDYGTTDTHPSAVALLQQDNLGRYWVRDIWMDKGGNIAKIQAAVESRKKIYDVHKGRTDPKQAWAAQQLNFNVALGSGPYPTEARIALANGLLEDGYLIFDKDNPKVEDAWKSMKKMRRIKDGKGLLVYDRDLGDDAAQSVLYALEELKGMPLMLPAYGDLGGVKQSWSRTPSGAFLHGRA